MDAKGDLYVGGPEDPDIPIEVCGQLCDGTGPGLKACQFAVRCDPAVSPDGEPADYEYGPQNCHPYDSYYEEGMPSPTLTFLVLCEVNYSSPGGRRPEGLAERSQCHDESAVAAYFANMAHLEAASVDAFDILAAELAAHGAPRSLRRAAARAAADEVRHARVMASFARRAGARIQRPRVRRPPSPRRLLDVALENAREGCVRETYGALVALWQTHHATEPKVRSAFDMIARDEARHAALSWRVASWAHSRLSDTERERVEAALTATVADLFAELRVGPPPELTTLGLPSAPMAVALFSDLVHRLKLRAPAQG